MTTKSLIRGKSGNEYLFQSYSINEMLGADQLGVFVFTKRIKDNSGLYTEKYSCALASIDVYYGVINEDLINEALDKGATSFIFFPSEARSRAAELDLVKWPTSGYSLLRQKPVS